MIREATVDDLKPLVELYKEQMLFQNKFDPQSFPLLDDSALENKMKDILEESTYRVICNETDGTIDGCAIFLIINIGSSAEKPDGELLVSNIIVAEDFRRRGIGTALINEIFTIAKEQFCGKVIVDVYPENIDARKFYEKMGLVPKTIKMEKRI